MKDKSKSIFSDKSPAGKGDKPRNISKKYWDNYDEIKWNSKKKDSDLETEFNIDKQ